MSTASDYAALVKQLPTLRNLVDACGEVTLTAEEAAKLRSLGFRAEEGRWKVPPVPPDLVRDNPLLEHLSIGWDSGRNEAASIPIQITAPQVKDAGATVQHQPAREAEICGRYEMSHRPTATSTQAPAGAHLEACELASKILTAVERNRGEITRRTLQQKFWRYKATIFNQALRQLARCGRITLNRKS
jgi:hypothetical protein